MEASYIVVPFERQGHCVGTRQMVAFPSLPMARYVAAQMSAALPGVAIIERTTDDETGEDADRVIAAFGAVPAGFPSAREWSLRLN